jgi:hypothetical protein
MRYDTIRYSTIRYGTVQYRRRIQQNVENFAVRIIDENYLIKILKKMGGSRSSKNTDGSYFKVLSISPHDIA